MKPGRRLPNSQTVWMISEPGIGLGELSSRFGTSKVRLAKNLRLACRRHVNSSAVDNGCPGRHAVGAGVTCF